MWRDTPHDEGYEVSDDGRVRNKQTGRILAPSSNGYGVLKVILSHEGEKKTRIVGRLVGEAWLNDYEEGDVIFYKDDDRSNVSASNLEWRPRWFCQEWAHQLKRTEPMRPWPILMEETGVIYNNSLECALQTYGIEKYIVFSCGRGDTLYNGSTYSWASE
jgi:hypothetical protein